MIAETFPIVNVDITSISGNLLRAPCRRPCAGMALSFPRTDLNSALLLPFRFVRGTLSGVGVVPVNITAHVHIFLSRLYNTIPDVLDRPVECLLWL